MTVRSELPDDREAIFAIHSAAFETTAEAKLVDALRERANPFVSLVAEAHGSVIGHILFTLVTHAVYPECKIMGLAPMAVAPAHQNTGIGSALIEAGFETCRRMGFGAVVVLGHPEYYPRFGFVPSARFGIDSEYQVPDDVFMAIELIPEFLAGKSGRVTYHEAFGSVAASPIE